jgi:hypothetical protein
LSGRDGFSIVISIAEWDAGLVPKTLPSWLSLGSADVVLCVDAPASEKLLDAIGRVVGKDNGVRVLQIPENPAWRFRHAFTRREGFRAAKFDKVLTGDIDIIVNKSCLRAVELVGNNGVGLVSLSKRRGGGTLGEVARNSSKRLSRLVRKRTFFTGLYAMYRPYWLDSEDEEQLMKIEHPHVQELPQNEAVYLGEDVILRDAMTARHKIIYLPEVGGTDLRISLEDRAPIQARTGTRYYRDGKPMGYVLAQSIMYGRGTLLGTYADLLFREKGGIALFREYAGSIAFGVRGAETYFLRKIKSKRKLE